MRLSTIDIGSNTVRLLVADVLGSATWQVVD
jgi:exopolyphosphatase/pppGpp-phosphohydrolase